MIVEELQWRIVAKKDYGINISMVVEKMKTEQKHSGASLAKISEVLKKEKKHKKYNQ